MTLLVRISAEKVEKRRAFSAISARAAFYPFSFRQPASGVNLIQFGEWGPVGVSAAFR